MTKRRPMTAGEQDWIFGGRPRNQDRVGQIQARVSEAIKGFGPKSYHRFDKAAAFARKMRAKASRLRNDRQHGIIDAMCFGFGSGHRREMIRRYEAAAMAAERFCRRRR